MSRTVNTLHAIATQGITLQFVRVVAGTARCCTRFGAAQPGAAQFVARVRYPLERFTLASVVCKFPRQTGGAEAPSTRESQSACGRADGHPALECARLRIRPFGPPFHAVLS